MYYLNRSGRIWQPPGNVYSPVAFQTSPDTGRQRAYAQWAELSQELAAQMAALKVANTVNLAPDVDDVRAWQWQGLLTNVKYTFYQDFPYELAQANQSVRSRMKKARKAGYRTRRADRLIDVFACLNETERRSGFRDPYSPTQLEMVERLLGKEHLRSYAAYGPHGEVGAAYVVLHNPGGYALAWIISTRTAHLKTGVTQLLHDHVVADLQDAGAAGFDLVGANMETVAAAKASWGPRLVPYYSVQQYGARRIAAYTYHGVRDVLARRSAARSGSRGSVTTGPRSMSASGTP